METKIKILQALNGTAKNAEIKKSESYKGITIEYSFYDKEKEYYWSCQALGFGGWRKAASEDQARSDAHKYVDKNKKSLNPVTPENTILY